MSDVVSHIMKDQIFKLAARGMREDGRAFDRMRPMSIETGIVGPAEGSARVRLGDTDVFVGVKVELGTPFQDRPTDGVLMTGAELRPIAHADFETGPPQPPAVEISRVIDRGIRESQMIDLSKLCITPKEKVYMVFVDIEPLDYFGNIFDAGAAGAVAALRTAKVPAKRHGFGEDFPMPVRAFPASVTFAKIGKHVMVDPTLREELVSDARLTIVTDEKGDVRAMQKGLSGSFSYAEIKECLLLATKLGRDVRALKTG
ncbi:MAG: exosome complex protein Rrp42 [Euryarchaeota archaeon]|nr:exosome complex protein Rrp42 [Euryarchaeota archaeon]